MKRQNYLVVLTATREGDARFEVIARAEKRLLTDGQRVRLDTLGDAFDMEQVESYTPDQIEECVREATMNFVSALAIARVRGYGVTLCSPPHPGLIDLDVALTKPQK